MGQDKYKHGLAIGSFLMGKSKGRAFLQCRIVITSEFLYRLWYSLHKLDLYPPISPISYITEGQEGSFICGT